MAISDAALLWAAALGLWWFDGVRRVEPDQIVILPSPWGVRTLMLRNPPGIGGRRFHLANPLRPFEAEVYLAATAERRSLRSDELFLLRRALSGFRVPLLLSGAAFILLFVAIPAATRATALLPALMMGIGAVWAINLAQLAWLWPRRRLYDMGGRNLAKLAFSQFLCPPNAANFARHLAARYRPKIDAMAAAIAVDPGGEVARRRRLARNDEVQPREMETGR